MSVMSIEQLSNIIQFHGLDWHRGISWVGSVGPKICHNGVLVAVLDRGTGWDVLPRCRRGCRLWNRIADVAGRCRLGCRLCRVTDLACRLGCRWCVWSQMWLEVLDRAGRFLVVSGRGCGWKVLWRVSWGVDGV